MKVSTIIWMHPPLVNGREIRQMESGAAIWHAVGGSVRSWATVHLTVQCSRSYNYYYSLTHFVVYSFVCSSGSIVSADRIELCIEQRACRVSILRRPSIADWHAFLLGTSGASFATILSNISFSSSIQLHYANICSWVRRPSTAVFGF